MNIFVFLAIGLLTGWIAGMIVKGRGLGVIGDLVAGVVGAFVGGFIFNSAGVATYGLAGAIISSVLGAVIVLLIASFLSRRPVSA